MNTSGLIIRQLIFTGSHVEPAQLHFDSGLNLLYGASNTGKSFSLKAIDFMLGGSDLPDIPERIGYDKIWFGFSLKGVGDFTLSRSTEGGDYELYNGFIDFNNPTNKIQILAPTQQTKSTKSLPHYLLEQLGFSGRKLAKNADGVTNSISFRDLAVISLVDETSIQSERSPIETGQRMSRSKERSLFRMLLTGQDDSSITPVVDLKTFNTSKAVRIEVIEDMLRVIESKLSEYPNVADLPSQSEKLLASLAKIQSEFEAAQGSVRVLIDEKRTLSLQIPKLGQRIDEIEIHLDRFKQLDQIYLSDIERLSALEEAGFLMALGGKKACTLCGTPTELQTHALDLQSIERVQTAALIEITKIESQRKGLQVAIADLAKELANITLNYSLLSQRLDTVEREINRLAPQSSEIKLTLNEIIVARDRNREGLLLLEQRNDFKAKLEEYTKLQKPSKDDKPKLKTPDAIIHEFCQMVGHVLKCWEFPGNCDVSFDDKMFDLKIDGKLRINNGKGVRAVTHAAFKVALLIFCRENKLPHTGFIVLDTPLLTYRDPMKDPKAEKLSDDEKIIAQSSLKQKFFEHLSSISHFGQIIILENVDPPNNIESIAHVQTFYGAEESSRNGLFPVNHRN